jgi:predicted unusual protein kinase regulating ubiquinone biosynthesis (AarF/ABC1/UbiB family)
LALGPVYIKIGQILSTQSNIPLDITRELTCLQDNIDQISWIEATSGLDIPHCLRNVQNIPIAAASLGVVYRGEWLDLENTQIVIKVLRPNIRRSVALNLWTITRTLRYFSSSNVEVAHLLDIARQYRKSIWTELDYIREAQNLDALAESLSPLDWNRVPEVFYADANILVLQYIPGIKINDVDGLRAIGLNLGSVADNLMYAFLYQCLIANIWQSDLHPGNIAVTADDDENTPFLVWYDGGSVLRYNAMNWREDLISLSISLSKSDIGGIVNSLETMKIIKNDRKSKKVVARFIQNLLDGSINDSIDSIDISMVADIDFNGLGEDLRQAFVSDSQYVLLGKSLLVIQSNCKILDPTYNLIPRVVPLLKQFWSLGDNTASVNLFDELIGYGKNIGQLPGKIKILEARVMDLSDETIDRYTNSNSMMINMVFLQCILQMILYFVFLT